VVLFLLAVGVFFHAGTWLVREDPVQKAQVVVVLSGGLPERALAAAEVFKASGAREVWLTRPLQPGAAMQQLRLPYAGEEQYSRMVLIDRGVPPAAIRALTPQIDNTADELQAVFDREAVKNHVYPLDDRRVEKREAAHVFRERFGHEDLFVLIGAWRSAHREPVAPIARVAATRGNIDFCIGPSAGDHETHEHQHCTHRFP